MRTFNNRNRNVLIESNAKLLNQLLLTSVLIVEFLHVIPTHKNFTGYCGFKR